MKILKDIEKLNMGYNSNFNVLDDDDSKSIIREIIKDLKIDSKKIKVNYQEINIGIQSF